MLVLEVLLETVETLIGKLNDSGLLAGFKLNRIVEIFELTRRPRYQKYEIKKSNRTWRKLI